MTTRSGMVYLVGAGPGDPGLISVRGRELLERADVVLHDRLVSPEVLEMAAPSALLVDIGKTAWQATVSQDEINAALVRYAEQGHLVVRLKGGDPFVFGRGWEEYVACRDAGIPCEVVPGITSAIAGPAAAGIPVTTRGVASSLFIAAAHGVSDHEIEAAVNADTSVFLMGVRDLERLATALVHRGLRADTPAAIVERATLPGQRVVRGDIESLARLADEHRIESPAVIVVGETTALLANRGGPLAGKRVMVTRPLTASRPLSEGLRALGADVLSAPLIELALHDEFDANVIARLEEFDWIVFASRHAVRGFRRAIERAGLDTRALSRAWLGAIGPTVARELAAWGLRADIVASPARADALADRLIAQRQRPRRVLFPCGTLAFDTIPDRLAVENIACERLPVYTTRKLTLTSRIHRELERGVDAILFAAPSAVEAFVASQGDAREAPVICIGTETASIALARGLRNVCVADLHSDQGLIQATVSLLGRQLVAR